MGRIGWVAALTTALVIAGSSAAGAMTGAHPGAARVTGIPRWTVACRVEALALRRPAATLIAEAEGSCTVTGVIAVPWWTQVSLVLQRKENGIWVNRPLASGGKRRVTAGTTVVPMKATLLENPCVPGTYRLRAVTVMRLVDPDTGPLVRKVTDTGASKVLGCP